MATIAAPLVVPRTADEPTWLWSWLATTDHKRIGALYLFTALTFMLIGGAEAEVMRTQLMKPNQHIVSAELYNQLFTRADPDVASATVAALQRPPDWREAKDARKLAERCWETLATAVVENVAHESAESYYLHNACPILMERKAVTGLRAARCQSLGFR